MQARSMAGGSGMGRGGAAAVEGMGTRQEVFLVEAVEAAEVGGEQKGGRGGKSFLRVGRGMSAGMGARCAGRGVT